MRCVVAIVIIGAGMATAQPAPGGGSIEGHVVHALSGAPVARATVRLSASASSIWLVAETDVSGRFEFTGLPAGT
ncbi:MAG: carboxypeptidase regulatory-like domain-containing protein [Acidobacteria bacterium]|nr:carboxypeptidase regulatory-like domain-containing protein [Acidobacteriota bacterium]